MKTCVLRRLNRRLAFLVLAGALVLSLGGCPIDSELILTETVRAGLQAGVDSLVETLSAYFAGN